MPEPDGDPAAVAARAAEDLDGESDFPPEVRAVVRRIPGGEERSWAALYAADGRGKVDVRFDSGFVRAAPVEGSA